LELLSLNFLWEQKGLLAVKVKEKKKELSHGKYKTK
jgi:hypothetical protein